MDKARCQKEETEGEKDKMEVEEERGPRVGQRYPKSQEYSPCCMSFHSTQYLELSSKVTRQLCFELLTWGTEKEEERERVAGAKLQNTVFLTHFCPRRARRLIRPPPCAPESRAWPEGEGGWQFLEGLSTGSLELYSQGLGDDNLVGMLRTD